MKFIGYFDIGGMTPHQALAHLTEAQQANYEEQIARWLESNHFEVETLSMELAVVSDVVLVTTELPAGPLTPPNAPRTQTEPMPRLRLQFTVDLQPLPAPKPSGLILPGQQNGQMQGITLVPLPNETPQ